MNMIAVPLHHPYLYHVYNIYGIHHVLQDLPIHFHLIIKDGGINLHKGLHLLNVSPILCAVLDHMEILQSI